MLAHVLAASDTFDAAIRSWGQQFSWPAEQILLFGRRRRSPFPRALSLAGRIERSASIPVDWITHTAAAAPAGHRPHAALRCVPTPPAAA